MPKFQPKIVRRGAPDSLQYVGNAARRKRLAATFAGALVAAVASCSDPVAPVVPPLDSVKPEWVTGPAASALSPTGQFYFSAPAVSGEVDSASAIALADGYVTWVVLSAGSGQLRQGMEQLRQGPIDWVSLKRCRSMVRAYPVFGPLPDSASHASQRFFAAKWIVPLCEASGAQSVMIDISARATDVHFDSTGLVYDASEVVRGDEMTVYPQPARFAGLYLSPELAVSTAFAFAGRRVRAVPQAVMRGTSSGGTYVGAASRWRVSLEDSVAVVTGQSGRRLFLQELWVARDSAYRPVVLTPALAQPVSVTIQVFVGNPATPTLVALRVPTQQPVAFETVSRP